MSQGDTIDQIYDHLFVERTNGLTKAEFSAFCDLKRRLLERHGNPENLFIAINNMELGRIEFGDEYREFNRLRGKRDYAEFEMEIKRRGSGAESGHDSQCPLFNDEHRQAGMQDPVEDASSRCNHDEVEWMHGDHRLCTSYLFTFELCEFVVCATCQVVVSWDVLTEDQLRHLFRTA